MGKLRWYKRDPVAALEGMSNLTLEERGAYDTVLDLIYARDGAVDDDARFIAGWCRCDVRVWKRIRARLIELSKIYVDGGQLRNRRADREAADGIERTEATSEINRAKGVLSGKARRSGRDAAQHRGLLTPLSVGEPGDSNGDKSNGVNSKNRGLAEPTPEPETNTTTTTTTEDSKRESALSARQPAKAKRGTRLPEDWSPDLDGYQLAVDTLGSKQAAQREFENFRDYWHARAGPGGVKLDWDATWRVWIRRSNANGPAGKAARISLSEQARQLADEAREFERQAGLGRPPDA